jgi:hypothetical protein
MSNDAKNFLVRLVTEKSDPRSHLTWSLFWSRIKATSKAKAIKR